LTTSKEQPLSNRAIAGTLYHPGSVFKLVVAAAALDSGEYNEESTFENPATLTLPQSDSTVSNSNGQTCGYGDRVTIATALRLSCNIPFAELGSALGQDRIRSYAEAFGFGAKIEIPMTSTPSVYPTDMDEAQVSSMCRLVRCKWRWWPRQSLTMVCSCHQPLSNQYSHQTFHQ
jgi:peptidoglycan glycosyltransferase